MNPLLCKYYLLVAVLMLPYFVYSSSTTIEPIKFECTNIEWEKMRLSVQTNTKEVQKCLLNKIENKDKLSFNHYYYLAQTYRYQANNRECTYYSTEALKYSTTIEDSIKSLLLLSHSYRTNDNLSRAQAVSLQALDLAKRTTSMGEDDAFTKIELARIKYTLKDSLKAARYIQDVEKIIGRSADNILKGEFYYQKARVQRWYHRHTGLEDIAVLVEKSLDFFKASNEYYKMASSLDFLGTCHIYFAKKDYKKVRELLEQSLDIKDILGNQYGKAITHNNIGISYYEQLEDSIALINFKKSINMSKSLKAFELLVDSYENIASVYEPIQDNKLGNADSCVYYLRLESIYRDSLRQRQRADLIYDLDTRYEIPEKNQKIKTQKKKINYLSIGSGLLFLIAVLTYLLYRQISQVNTFKNQLFSIMGHDLRGMMSSAYAAKRSIERTNKKAENQLFNQPINKMGSVIDGLNGFIENILYWGFAQTNRVNIRRKKIEVEEVTDEVVGYFTYDLERKNIQLKKDIPTDFHIQADEETTKVVLRNLLSNAIKFSPVDGEILVSAQQSGQYNLVHVKDSGTGIPPERIPYLFAVNKEKVTRGTTGEKGTGLGLWLCKEMIRRNKGKITVQSSPQEGTCFTLYFPKI